ncbi:MAG: DUF3299 domain-containing protein [bacterium]|nr:DUF3299 domain-containing protein [bacterium]
MKATSLFPIATLCAAALLASCGNDITESAAAASLPPVQGAELDLPIVPKEPDPKPVRDADTVPASDAGTTEDESETNEPETTDESTQDGEAAVEPAELPVDEDGVVTVSFLDLMLDDEIKEDLLDALIYPDDYSDEEREFPDEIKTLDSKQISITGYMIPVLWDETKVTEFMLVGDLLACCFGGAPEPDEWLNCVCVDGYKAEYYPFVPVVVTGKFKIDGIEDDAGYAAGAYHMAVDSVEKEL